MLGGLFFVYFGLFWGALGWFLLFCLWKQILNYADSVLWHVNKQNNIENNIDKFESFRWLTPEPIQHFPS